MAGLAAGLRVRPLRHEGDVDGLEGVVTDAGEPPVGAQRCDYGEAGCGGGGTAGGGEDGDEVTTKIHYNGNPDSVIPLPFCGHIGGTVTKDVRAVTCKLCKRRLFKAAKKSEPIPAYVEPAKVEPV